MALATCLGIGRAPVASGTVGSVPGLLIVWGLWIAGGTPAVAFGLAGVIVVGWWAADGAAHHLRLRDPGLVVIDEVAGQMATLLLIAPTPGALAAGFVLFRIFDVWKPFPARQLEVLPGGWGIMADDLAAAIYANLVLQGVVLIVPGLAIAP